MNGDGNVNTYYIYIGISSINDGEFDGREREGKGTYRGVKKERLW